MSCKAQQQNDEMFCAACNLRWDVNDHEPAPCAQKAHKMVKYKIRVKRVAIKTITFECEDDPLLDKMELARECAEQCRGWDDVDAETREVTDIRKVKL